MKLINLAIITGLGVVLSACGSAPAKDTNASVAKPPPQNAPMAYARPYTIRGSVSGQNNQRVSNIVVELIPNQCFQKTQATVRTDALGRYEFTNVPNGDYVLGLNGFSTAGPQNKNAFYQSTCSDKHIVKLRSTPKGMGVVRNLSLQPK